MTGSGNDFVMVDGRVSTPEDWVAADIRAACARGTGVGADGVVFVLAGSAPGAVRMVYFNSDGSHAAMCGNAALCCTHLAAHLGVAPADGMRLETDAGVYESRCASDAGRAELHLAAVESPVAVPDIELEPGGGEQRLALGVVGVPHLVVVVDDVERVPLTTRGRTLRFHAALAPHGANINFVSQARGSAEWRMRTYERGVEGETLACGTGAVAAACALTQWGLAQLPTVFLTSSGRRLDVRAVRTADERYDDVWLGGEARMVFRGVLT
ncbi:MAG TPA: diaminopimelate epimerase [Gemmatimonadales bacterium]|nr:diaminopimelate epimerase [Gemmatimonadales bacterium]